MNKRVSKVVLAERLQAGLAALASSSPVFRGVRGRGLLQALVVASPKRHPPAEFVARARAHALLVTRAGEDAVRLLPPLNCSESEIDAALGILEAVAGEMRPPARELAAAKLQRAPAARSVPRAMDFDADLAAATSLSPVPSERGET